MYIFISVPFGSNQDCLLVDHVTNLTYDIVKNVISGKSYGDKP